jgi:hypothetical protein
MAGEMFLASSKSKMRTGVKNTSAIGTSHVVPEFFYRGPMGWYSIIDSSDH